MFPEERLATTPAVHARVRIPGRPGSGRTIELPQGAPGGWLIRAYLLSIGVEHDEYVDDPGLRVWVEPWSERVQRVDVPELSESIEVELSFARTPEFGEQLVCLLDEDVAVRSTVQPSGAWWEDPPPFSIDAVNRELLDEFGIVVPHRRDRISHSYEEASSIRGLLVRLSPVRRLALKAHLVTVGNNAEPLDMHAVTQGLRTLMERIGSEGVLQDPASGWVASGTLDRVVRDLGWTPSAGVDPPNPGGALLAFARRMRLFRRLRGEVVLTNRGHGLLREPERCRRELHDALREICAQRSWGLLSDEAVVVLLAIADGTVETVSEVADALVRGSAGLGVDRASGYGLGADGSHESRRSEGVPPEVKDLLGAFAVLSPAGAYGSFSPSIRALALALPNGAGR